MGLFLNCSKLYLIKIVQYFSEDSSYGLIFIANANYDY